MSIPEDAWPIFADLENLYQKQSNKDAFSKKIKSVGLFSFGSTASALLVKINAQNFEEDHSYLGNVIDEYDKYFVQGASITGLGSLVVGAGITIHRGWQKLNEPIVGTANVDTADAIPSRFSKARRMSRQIMLNVVKTQTFMNQHIYEQPIDETVRITEVEITDILTKSQNLEEYYRIDRDGFDDTNINN